MERKHDSLPTAPKPAIDLIPISDPAALAAAGIPFTGCLLRKWHHLGRYPRIFVKILRRVYIDRAEWARVVADAKRTAERRAERIERTRRPADDVEVGA